MSVENHDEWDYYKYIVKSHGERIMRLERIERLNVLNVLNVLILQAKTSWTS
jgi:hypothetical protein